MQIGFFKKEQIGKPKPVTKRSGTTTKALGCIPCGLYKTCNSPKMDYTGDGKKDILVIAEAPGKIEDNKGLQLVGEAGQLLRRVLQRHDIDLDEDCWKINAVNCRPQKNRTPTSKEIEHCRSRVWKTIEELKPKLILLLGGVAVESFLGHRWKKNLGGITKWRGWHIPDQDVNAWVCPTFHPSYVMRMTSSAKPGKGMPVVKTIWKQDIARALGCLDIPVPNYKNAERFVKILKEPEEIKRALTEIIRTKPELLNLDYETTGKKPYAKGHQIYTAAMSYKDDEAISFPVTPEVMPYLRRVLADKRIGKSAHNRRFEDMWTKALIPKGKVASWKWCSQNTSHILDNRENITWFKFQVYVNFGIVDYDSHIEPFLQSKNSKDANSFNCIKEAPLNDVLLYGGLDGLYGLWLVKKQMRIINEDEHLQKGNVLFHEGLTTMGSMEQAGLNTDLTYYSTQSKRLTYRIEKLEKQVEKSEEVALWREKYGGKTNLNSNPQLADMLYNELKIKPVKFTEKGKPSVDQEALISLDAPFVKYLTEIARLKKARDTFIAGIMREAAADGLLHPFFHLHKTSSYRGSSSNPNFQNIPVRDAEVKRIIRRGIIPRLGRQLVEIDYSGIEVKVSACVHHDPRMIEYIEDPTTDMHRDMAMECYVLSIAEVSEDTRYCAKNKFVFPEFYGDYYMSCAKTLWDAIEAMKLKTEKSNITLKQHLKQQGIRSHADFEQHIKEVEHRFWHERFPVYTEWKKQHMQEYEKRGWFDLLTGFRVHEVLTRNEALNRPIQGPAFHCLLWSANRLHEIAQKEKWQSLIVGQIHDSIVMDVVPDELDLVLKTAQRVMCEDIKEWAHWLIVPLKIDCEVAPINKPWYDKKKVRLAA